MAVTEKKWKVHNLENHPRKHLIPMVKYSPKVILFINGLELITPVTSHLVSGIIIQVLN